MKTRIPIAILLLIPLFLRAQIPIGSWKSYTDMKSVRGMDISGPIVWAATGGGVFSIDTVSGSITQFNNTDGLTNNDVTAIAVAPDGSVWLGASDGSIDVYDPSRSSWTAISSIRNSTRLKKNIVDFVMSGDTVLVVAGFGVSVFKRSRWEFGDSYAGFGFSGQPEVAGAVFAEASLWIATDAGVVRASRNDPALTTPSAWTRYTDLGGISFPVTAIANGPSGILIGSGTGVSHFTGTGFEGLAAFAGTSIRKIRNNFGQYSILLTMGSDTRLFLVDGNSLNSNRSWIVNGNLGTSFVLPGNSSTAWIGTTTRGIAQLRSSGLSFTVPDGPQSNQFISLGVDERGKLWAASGMNSNGTGFYRFDPIAPDGAQWKNFTLDADPRLLFNDYYKVSVTSDSSVWMSSWGRGVVQLRGDTIVRRIDAASVPSLAGAVPQDPSFVVAGSVVRDNAGKFWIDVRTAVNNNHLSRLVNDTTFEYYQNQYNLFEGLFQSMVIDQNGTKWIGNSEPWDKKDRGLYFFNEKKLVSGTQTTGGWGLLSSADGLASNSILSLAVDQEGDVWAGTDLGAVIITNPLAPRTGRLTSYPVREQSIQSIAVDAVNQKWLGTKEGVFVLSPDGTQLIAQYTVLSTGGKLTDNDVRAIAIDQRRGWVYLGTEKGLSRLQIAAVQPRAEYSVLEFSPNPFLVPAAMDVQISGLVENSSIKIMTASGSLVRDFKAQGGGRAFWDGRDQTGTAVSSGIYFVVASAENGARISTGKLAVIRK